MARPKGSQNKNKTAFREALLKYMKSREVDPHFYMVDLIADAEMVDVVVGDGAVVRMPAVSRKLKFEAARELAQYIQPKLKSVELTGDQEHPLAFAVEMISYGAQDTITASL